MKIRDTYKYKVLRNNVIIYRGVTNDLHRAASEHKARYPDCIVKQVGHKTTRVAALKWARKELKRQ